MLLLLAVAILTATCSATRQQPTLRNADNSFMMKPKVIVVGAGAAGLSAAQELIAAGFKVTLLEASNRYGGRLWSVPSEAGGGWLELGGQWVHGHCNPLYDFAQSRNLLAKAYDLRKDAPNNEEEDSNIPLLHANGAEVTNVETRLQIHATLDEMLFNKSAYNAFLSETGLSLGQHLLNSYHKIRKSVAEDKIEAADQTYDAYVRLQKADYGADDFFKLSIHSVANISIDGPHAIDLNVPYTDVLKMWARDAIKNIQFGALVKRINFRTGQTPPLSVTLSNGTELGADHVIMTAAVGHLKTHLDELFDPPLSERKRAAIQSVGFGTLGKLHLVYDEEWWWNGTLPPYYAYLFDNGNDITVDRNKTYSGQPWTRAIAFVMESPTMNNTLIVMLGGSQAVEMESLTDAEVSASVTALLRQSTGKVVPEPKKVLRGRWSQNDLFRGAYIHITMEMVKQGLATEDLASSEYWYEKDIGGWVTKVPGLLFAGEATHPKYWSMVHGALLSGQREATRLKETYGKVV